MTSRRGDSQSTGRRSEPQPPAAARRLLEAGIPPGRLQDSIVGDLHEEFAERCGAGRHRLWAMVWYWMHALRLRRHFSSSWHRLTVADSTHYVPRSEARMNRWKRDLRYAWRSLRRTPGFAAMVMLTLGIGMGAAVTIFSVVNGVLLTPLAYPEPDRLVSVWGISINSNRHPLPSGDFEDLRLQADTLHVGGRWTNTGSLIGDFEPEEVSVGWVDPGYFAVLGIRALHGRLLEASDEDAAVMLSHGVWRRRFSADPAIVGRFIQVGDDRFEVVGILPSTPDPNVPDHTGRREANDVWRVLNEGWYRGSDDRDLGWIRVTARLREGVTVRQAQEQLEAIALAARPIDEDTGRPERWFGVESLHGDLVGNAASALFVLLGAVGFLLLIASFNVAQLLASRGSNRSGELAVRAALGARRSDLTRQLACEAAILSLGGGVLGTAIATAGVRGLTAIAPDNLPRPEAISVDGRVLLFTLATSCLVALIVGIVPALHATRGAAENLRRAASGVGRQRGQRRFGEVLMIGEVALALVLLAGAGLLLRSFVALVQVHPGFVPEQLLTLSVTSSGEIDADAGGSAVFFNEFRRALADTPGVVAAGGANRLPLAGGLYSGFWATEAMGGDFNDKPGADFRWITPGYFRAMGTRVIRGRELGDADPPSVVLVDEQLALQAWPDEDPIGQRLWTGRLGLNGEWAEVIGIVEPMKHTGLADESRPTVYFHAGDATDNRMYFAVRGEGAAVGIVGTVREVARRIDPNATISRVHPMTDLVARANAPWTFAFFLMSMFAGIGILVTVVGLYGTVAYAVSRRTREIGIRVALGAPRKSVLQLVLAQTAAMTLAGVVLGTAGAVSMSSVLSSHLYGVEATDTATYAGVALLMVVVALLAAWQPTRRALKIDPCEALVGD